MLDSNPQTVIRPKVHCLMTDDRRPHDRIHVPQRPAMSWHSTIVRNPLVYSDPPSARRWNLFLNFFGQYAAAYLLFGGEFKRSW